MTAAGKAMALSQPQSSAPEFVLTTTIFQHQRERHSLTGLTGVIPALCGDPLVPFALDQQVFGGCVGSEQKHARKVVTVAARLS